MAGAPEGGEGGHEGAGFAEGEDDAAVVLEAGGDEVAAAAVFQPLLGGLVAADPSGPVGFFDVREVLGGVDSDFAVGVFGFLDAAIARPLCVLGGLCVRHPSRPPSALLPRKRDLEIAPPW